VKISLFQISSNRPVDGLPSMGCETASLAFVTDELDYLNVGMQEGSSRLSEWLADEILFD